jgi:mRNA interferase MazF
MAHSQRGEVWTVDFDPVRGHEQGGLRPALVVSTDSFNAGPAALMVVLPITSRGKGIRWHVAIDPPEGGLTVQSFVKCDNVRSISQARLSRHWGIVSAVTLKAVEDRLRILLDL